MRRSLGLVVPVLASAAAISLAGCGGSSSGTPTAQRYASAHQLVAALGSGGFQCTQPFYLKTPSTAGATSGATCTFNGAMQEIDVFSSTVTTKMVLADTASAGSEQIWSDVGQNWMVETSKADAKLVQKAIGGRVIGGPWHPPAGQ